jgi:hypothetical protein
LEGKGPKFKERQKARIGGIYMQQSIELYEMVSLNDGALRGTERLAILKATLALRMFERAMQSFAAELSQKPVRLESFAGPSQYQSSSTPATKETVNGF